VVDEWIHSDNPTLEQYRMKFIVVIGLIIFLFIAIGFVFYLFRLNRQAKKEQSEVDPEKLRKWEDN